MKHLDRCLLIVKTRKKLAPPFPPFKEDCGQIDDPHTHHLHHLHGRREKRAARLPRVWHKQYLPLLTEVPLEKMRAHTPLSYQRWS